MSRYFKIIKTPTTTKGTKVSDLFDLAHKQRKRKVAIFLKNWVNEETIEQYIKNNGGTKPNPRLKGGELVAKESPWKYIAMRCPCVGWKAIEKIESFLIENGIKTHG